MMLASAHAENSELLKDANNLRAVLAVTKGSCSEAIAETQNRRKRDLESVETRVREVVRGKESQVRRMLERAERAERRAAELEKMLNALNDGFELVDGEDRGPKE